MSRYLYANELGAFPKLQKSVFRDRAHQFSRRLAWDVVVDSSGQERDEYDDLNRLYVIWETPAGLHGGSMRLLPTVGQTMVNDHFSHLTDGVHIQSPLLWKCTRFCLAQAADRRVSAALVLGAGEVMEISICAILSGCLIPEWNVSTVCWDWNLILLAALAVAPTKSALVFGK